MSIHTRSVYEAPTAATVFAILAFALGLINASFSVYWACGGTGLLSTVGGDIETWVRGRNATSVVSLAAVAAVKTVIAFAALAATGAITTLPQWMRGRLPRFLTWIAAITLTLYGATLTVAGLATLASGLGAASAPETNALVWHTLFWDPWFAVWGLALLISLWFTTGVVGGRVPRTSGLTAR